MNQLLLGQNANELIIEAGRKWDKAAAQIEIQFRKVLEKWIQVMQEHSMFWTKIKIYT